MVSDVSVTMLSQPKISAYIDTPLDPLNCILLMMIVMNGYPLIAIDDGYVKQAFHRAADTGYELSTSRNTLQKLLIRKHRAMKEEPSALPNRKSAQSRSCWMEWPDVVHSKVANVLLVCRYVKQLGRDTS
jgi:hypothetical protein